MSLDLDKLSALFELLAEKDIAEFEHEEGGVRVRVARGTRGAASVAADLATPSTALKGGPAVAGESDGDGDSADVTSPCSASVFKIPYVVVRFSFAERAIEATGVGPPSSRTIRTRISLSPRPSVSSAFLSCGIRTL